MAPRPGKRGILSGLLVLGALGVGLALWLLLGPTPGPEPASVDQPFEIPSPDQLAAMAPAQKAAIGEKVMAAMAEMPPTETDEPLPAESDAQPAVLAAGPFGALGEARMAAGEARLLELMDGTRVLRLEGFQVTNGPDLRVLLAATGEPEAAEWLEHDYTDLGPLKGSAGNQNYILPETVDLASTRSVVIWCRAFATPFAAALLE